MWDVNSLTDSHCDKPAYINVSQFPTQGCLMNKGPAAWVSGSTLLAERCDGIIELHYDAAEPVGMQSEYFDIRRHAEPSNY